MFGSIANEWFYESSLKHMDVLNESTDAENK